MNEHNQGVPAAYVPVVMAEMDGIPLKFIIARLVLSSIPEELTLKFTSGLG